ncbi:hypothetical protein PSENEW3_00000598 [Picochlorum sp. SENEW3]|nr:hypothetical protein PSENEW3_00000598 [Picochlorum sp. SENEW3]
MHQIQLTRIPSAGVRAHGPLVGMSQCARPFSARGMYHHVVFDVAGFHHRRPVLSIRTIVRAGDDISADGSNAAGDGGESPASEDRIDDKSNPEAVAEVEESTVEGQQEEVLVEDPEVETVPEASGPVMKAREFVHSNPIAGYSIMGIAGFLGITFVIAVVKTAAKGFGKKGRRTKTVNKNKLVIQELNKFLPEDRENLKGNSITGIRLRTGFTPTEIFRKYLWYLLRERKFDNDALADVIELKACLKLSDEEVAEALKERASRIFEKYGTVMLDTSGMSPAGVERKATSRALFSKMLYLVECDDVLDVDHRKNVDLRDIFGATEDDVARLRIASLYEVDLDAALNKPSAEPMHESEDEDN